MNMKFFQTSCERKNFIEILKFSPSTQQELKIQNQKHVEAATIF